jgi:heme/copper-type cytochrome/quinol oxidase subunit 2
MNGLEEYIEKLQNLSHNEKIKIMWIGVPIVMAVTVFIWLSFTNLGFQKSVPAEEKEEVSKFEVLKNGFSVTIKEIGSMFKDLKEKINKTNSFEIKAPQQNEKVDTAVATTTQTGKVLENTASTTNNK